MATDTDETSTGDERDENASSKGEENGNGGDGETSQAELAEAARQKDADRRHESKRKAGPIVAAASVALGALGLLLLYLSQSVEDLATKMPSDHPLIKNGLAVLGVINLVMAVAVFIRKNWPRALILALMPLDIVVTLLCLTNIPTGKYLVFVLAIVVIVLMFRRPVLDEYDAPKE